MKAPRASGRLAALVTAVTLAGTLVARPAEAYVRYYTELHAPFAWAEAVVPITAYLRDFNQDTMTADAVVEAVSAAADAWSDSQNDCTYLMIQPVLSMDAAPHAANDAHNALIFRSGRTTGSARSSTIRPRWPSPGTPPTAPPGRSTTQTSR
jgi:hypothetical protein